jgi:hypothetical protein
MEHSRSDKQIVQPVKNYPRILWNAKMYYCIGSSQPVGSILSHMNSVPCLPSCIFNVTFISVYLRLDLLSVLAF